MTRPALHEPKSPYYPPRAGWSSRVYGAWARLERIVGADPLRIEGERAWRTILLGLLVPGHAFRAQGFRRTGILLGATHLAALPVFLAAIGHQAADLAFGVMLSVHVTSATQVAVGCSEGARVRDRLLWGLVACLLLGSVIYLPVQRFYVNHWALPIRLEDRVIIVHPHPDPARIARGDLIAYRIAAIYADHVYLYKGAGLDRVLAVPGDRVSFRPGNFSVNGTTQPSLSGMPSDGELVVGENYWFIWPVSASIGRGHLTGLDKQIEEVLRRASLVPRADLLGKPYRRWLIWPQVLL